MKTPSIKKPGYHVTCIQKGTLGESSKILEEVLELIDAEKQHCSIMATIELSDLIGAIHAYLKKHHPTLTLSDLITMATITERAFKNNHRK